MVSQLANPSNQNPQMDAQAQDRAHRIGQTKPVLIFRLLTAHTIETEIMQRATEKRKLEALVIAKGRASLGIHPESIQLIECSLSGKFRRPASTEGRGKPETLAELASSLLKLEAEKIEVVPNTEAGKASVLSDEDMEMLLDRRPKVFADRGQGWTSASLAAEDGQRDAIVAGKKTAFAVYGTPVDEGNAALANMLGEDMI
jgi:ATP-dependent DNA helicase